MIIYFSDRRFNILGHASTNLPKGLTIVDDLKTEDVETGVSALEIVVSFDEKTRADVEEYTEAGNFLLRSNDDEKEFYTIIEREVDTKAQEIRLYAEDAGLDLLNEIAPAYEASELKGIDFYINKFAYDSGFEIGVNEVEDLLRKLKWDDEETVTARLASIASQFDGCEISFSFETQGLKVTKKLINIYQERGKNTGVQLRLNRDIDGIVKSENIEDLATALKCKGATPEGKDNPITLSGYDYDDGDFYTAYGVLYSREALEKWTRYHGDDETQTGQRGHITKTFSYETESQETLCKKAIADLKKRREIAVNYDADIKRLPDNVQVGDRVSVIDEKGELFLSTRLLVLETSVTQQMQKATLGEFRIKGSGISKKVEELAERFAEVAQTRAEAIAAQLAAQKAQEEAEAAQKEAEQAKQAAEQAGSAADNAQSRIDDAMQDIQSAQNAAAEAESAAAEAERQAAQAKVDAAAAGAAVQIAQSNAEKAVTDAATAKGTAEQAKSEATDAKTTAAAAKADAAKATQDVLALGESLETVSQTMQADYARKTDLTETEATLQTQISQNAGQIASTASRLQITDETANNAKEMAETAKNTATAAQQQAATATQAATTAKTNAEAAQTAANNAASVAANAQAAAEEADEKAQQAAADLATAEANLESVKNRVGATEEDIEAAEQAVANAQQAATQAQTDAQNAQSAADLAKADAATAKTAADDAQRAADDAQDAADAAQAKANEAKAAADSLAVRVTSAETKITQNSEAIALRATKTEVENIKIGGRNLLKNTDVLYTRTNAATATSAKSASFVDGYDLQQLIGKTVVFSYLQHTLGTRDSSLSTDTSTNKRFGMHGTVKWKDSTGAKADKTSYPFTSFLTTTSNNKRVEEKFDLTPPAGYDTLSSFTFAIQMFSKPAADNAETWLLGYPKLEVGTKATDWTPAPEDQKTATQAVADNLANNYYTKTETAAEIKTASDGITLSVNNVKTTAESAKSSIDALKLGGRNLLRNSKGDDTTDWIYKGTIESDAEKGSCVVKSRTATTEDFLAPPRTGKVEPSTQYTFSCDIFVNEYVNSVDMFWLADTEANKKTGTSFVNATQFVVGLKPTVGKWQRITKTFTTKSDDFTGFIRIDNNGTKTAGTAAILKVANLKLEKGNRATDWTPAPEDVATVRQLSAAEARLEIAESGISSQVSVTEGLTTRMSAVEHTAQGLTVNLQTTNNNVVAAQTTADTANTNAATAQSTANSAKTTAEAAKKTLYHSAGGTSGTAGYVGICQLKVTGTYANRPILFGLSDRGKVSSNVSLQFANKNNTDPELSHLQYDGAIEVWAYKTGTSTWVLIAKKSEAYDTIYVDEFTNNNAGVTVTWTNTMYTALPTSNITKGTLLAGKITKATVDAAATTATNFLSYDATNGLLIGNKSNGSWSGYRAQVLPTAFNILSETGAVLASYGANLIELGKDNTEATISLCGGTGRMFSLQDEIDSTWFTIVSNNYLTLDAPQGVYLNSNYWPDDTTYVNTYLHSDTFQTGLKHNGCLNLGLEYTSGTLHSDSHIHIFDGTISIFNRYNDKDAYFELTGGSTARISAEQIYLNEVCVANSNNMTLQRPLIVKGGDSATAGKLILETGTGQITNSATGTLFGYLSSSSLGVGHSTCSLTLRGKDAKPTYNGTNLVLATDTFGATKGTTSYYGMLTPEGSDSGWIRTTSSGLIPYANGSGSIGSSSWQFLNGYFQNLYKGGKAVSTTDHSHAWTASTPTKGSDQITLSAHYVAACAKIGLACIRINATVTPSAAISSGASIVVATLPSGSAAIPAYRTALTVYANSTSTRRWMGSINSDGQIVVRANGALDAGTDYAIAITCVYPI